MDKQILLYHGTTSISALNILKSGGLKPRKETNSGNEVIKTTTKQMDAIYLTKNKDSAVSYGYDRTDPRGWTFKDNKIIIPVVFAILINTESDPLYIDEDTLQDDISNSAWTNFLLKNKIINDKSESKNWLYFYKKQPELALKILKAFPWQLGLEKSGSIVFEGNINLDRIKYIDLYYTPTEYIRVSDISLESFSDAYYKCYKQITYNYINKYKDELEYTESLPNPVQYELLPSKYNKLDGTIYKNINLKTLDSINDLCKKLNYFPFNKIIITTIGKFFMQHNTYINHIDNMTDFLDINKYLILDIENKDCLSISYFTYIRNNIGLLLSNKQLIDELGKGKSIVFEMKYHELKFFKTLSEFWTYVNKVEDKRFIIPANKKNI